MTHVSVYVTCPDEETAARIARDLLDKRLIACANIVPGVRSLYRWEGRIEDEPEVAMWMKTRRARLPAIEEAIAALHPYEVPCIVAFDLVQGAAPFLAWVDGSTS